jgi:cytochrome o ubiquinol oxidase subunit 2
LGAFTSPLRRARNWSTVVIRLLAVAPLITIAGCRDSSVFTPVGPVSDALRIIILDSVAIMLAIVVPTILATVAVAWWFRASNRRAKRDPTFVYSGRIEMVVWSIPTLTILFLGGMAWVSSHDLDPARPLKSTVQPLEVQVVAMDWKWLFIYPTQGVATINQLVVPVGTPLRMRLTSSSVMNTLFAPQVGSQLYVMNGMRGTMWWQVDRPGTTDGRSNMFSGDGFPGMSFKIIAIAPDQFAAWAASTRGQGSLLDDSAYRALLKQTSNVRPYAYGSVRPGLFDDIVLQRLPPGTGPVEAGNKNPFVRPVRTR